MVIKSRMLPCVSRVSRTRSTKPDHAPLPAWRVALTIFHLQHASEQPLTDEDVQLYGLWLESNFRHDEAMACAASHPASL